MTTPPRVVNTPEKVKRYARSLIRDTVKLDRMLRGTQNYAPLIDYFQELPPEAQDEIAYRLDRLRERIKEFRAARSPR